MIQKQTVYLPVKVEEGLDTLSGTNGKGEKLIYVPEDITSEGAYSHWIKRQQSFVFTEEQLNEYTTKVIKQASVEFANWIAYTKKHGGVKPLQEALIQYKLKSTEELFDKYLEMSK